MRDYFERFVKEVLGLGPDRFGEVLRIRHAVAFKATIPRRRTQGEFGDPDLHGGQQHAPLMAVEITG